MMPCTTQVAVNIGLSTTCACFSYFILNKDSLERLKGYPLRRVVAVLLMCAEYLLDAGCGEEQPWAIGVHNYRGQALSSMVECLNCFLYPDDLMFAYSRMGRLLVRLANYDENETVQEKAVAILSSFVWQVSLEKKLMMKTYGGIKIVVDFIAKRIFSEKSDFYLECAWSFLWNATDETCINCTEFMDCDGLQVFVDCYQAFKDEEVFLDTLPSMFGALGNVAEMDSLRPKLIKREILQIFQTVVTSLNDLEVQYNICGIIVNLAMIEADLWSAIVSPSKDDLLNIVVSCVQQWDLTDQREIQYRSLVPIIKTVKCHDDRVALWGVWALANLCHISTSQYVPMFNSEGGVEAVQELRSRTRLPIIHELATKVLTISEQNRSLQ